MTTTNIERPSLKRKLPLNSPAYIKTDVLLRPPVHFNDPECLTPFELAVAFGIIRLARHSLNEVWHQEAFERGGIRIEGEVKAGFPAYLKEYKRTEARCGEGYYKRKGSFEDGRRPPPKRETLKSIGKDSYKRHFADARNKAREVIEVEVSVRGLLEAAGLSADGRNTKKLDANSRPSDATHKEHEISERAVRASSHQEGQVAPRGPRLARRRAVSVLQGADALAHGLEVTGHLCTLPVPAWRRGSKNVRDVQACD